MFDAVDMQRRAHHGDIAAGHYAFDDVFSRVHSASDGDVDVEVAVENCSPVQARQQLRRRREMQRGPHFKTLRYRSRADRSD